jgi:hypothetical protein
MFVVADTAFRSTLFSLWLNKTEVAVRKNALLCLSDECGAFYVQCSIGGS